MSVLSVNSCNLQLQLTAIFVCTCIVFTVHVSLCISCIMFSVHVPLRDFDRVLSYICAHCFDLGGRL